MKSITKKTNNTQKFQDIVSSSIELNYNEELLDKNNLVNNKEDYSSDKDYVDSDELNEIKTFTTKKINKVNNIRKKNIIVESIIKETNYNYNNQNKIKNNKKNRK